MCGTPRTEMPGWCIGCCNRNCGEAELIVLSRVLPQHLDEHMPEVPRRGFKKQRAADGDRLVSAASLALAVGLRPDVDRRRGVRVDRVLHVVVAAGDGVRASR